jgi:predicted TIM-barrel fold metal-dependent hydrolase
LILFDNFGCEPGPETVLHGGLTIVDCHCHIIDPVRYPFAATGGYRPRPHEVGTRESFAAELDSHGVKCALLVQPSCYGIDNGAALDALAWQPQRFKMIGVVPPDSSELELDMLKARGVVGVRFNLQFDPHALIVADRSGLLARLQEQEYFVQVHGLEHDWTGAISVLRKANSRVIIDHMGLERTAGGLDQKGFQAVLRLAEDTDAVVKLSGFLRSSGDGPPFADLDRFAVAILERFGVTRCVWGSDWPFLGASKRPHYAQLLAPLARWLSNRSDCRAVLWDNAQRLFGFERQ